jgi:hypothetical protein
MPHATYNLRRPVWPIWKWEADYHGELTAQGYALSKRSARWAARCWLRSRRRPIAAETRVPNKLAA